MRNSRKQRFPEKTRIPRKFWNPKLNLRGTPKLNLDFDTPKKQILRTGLDEKAQFSKKQVNFGVGRKFFDPKLKPEVFFVHQNSDLPQILIQNW